MKKLNLIRSLCVATAAILLAGTAAQAAMWIEPNGALYRQTHGCSFDTRVAYELDASTKENEVINIVEFNRKKAYHFMLKAANAAGRKNDIVVYEVAVLFNDGTSDVLSFRSAGLTLTDRESLVLQYDKSIDRVEIITGKETWIKKDKAVTFLCVP